MVRCSIKSKEFKRLLEERESFLRLQEIKKKELEEQERKKIIKEQKLDQFRKLVENSKVNWRSELFPPNINEIEAVDIIEEIKIEVPEKFKSNWRKELLEGMVTTDATTVTIPATDVSLDTIDAADPSSFTATVGGFDFNGPEDGLSGAQIVSSGTGSGNNGGFNLGRSYLSFNGVGFDSYGDDIFDNKRHVLLTPVDTSRATTLEITAIVGNGSNGGEAPSVDQDLKLWYTNSDGYPGPILAALDDTGNIVTAVPYNGSGSLRTYSVTIPSNEFNNLRRQGIQFVLFQDQGNNPTTTGDNYGITEIKVKRTTPISVIAPLDSPEAVSFFRVGPTLTGANYETPEQRYRRVMQQLLASKSYTDKIFGSNYPGSNFSGIRGVSSSPVDKKGMYDAWSKASERNAELAASTFLGSQKLKNSTPPSSLKTKGPLGTVMRAASANLAAAKSASTFKSIPQKPSVSSTRVGSLAGKDLQGRPLTPGPQNPTPPGYKGTFKPGPLTGKDLEGRPLTSTTSKTTPTSRVQDFGARMDAARNPNTGGYRDILPSQQGPNKPPSTVSKAPTPSAKPAAKPSFTPQQQQNIKSVQSQLRNVVSNVGVKLTPAGIAASVFKPTAAGNPAADRNPQQYTKQVQQQYAQKAASSGQFGKYAPPSTQVKTPTSTSGYSKASGYLRPTSTPTPAPKPTFQNTGGYGKYAPPSTQVKTPTPTSTSGGYSKASGYLRPVSTPAPTQTFQNTGGYGKYAPPSTQVKTPSPAPKPAAPKPTTTAKKK